MGKLSSSGKRPKNYWRLLGWLSLSFLAACLIAYFIFIEYSRHTMNAFVCKQLTPEAIQIEIAAKKNGKRYAPANGEITLPVTMHLNMATEFIGDVFFTIRSNKTRSLVYGDKFQKKIIFQVGQELLENGSTDNLTFSFYDTKTNKVCIAAQQIGYDFWKPNSNVHVDFLAFRETDAETGLPMSFKVRLE